MGGAPSIPAPPPLPPPPKVEDPAIVASREKFKTTLAERTTRKGTVLTKQSKEGQLLGEEASVLRTKLGGGIG
tara:strand:+ start:323 stop:541 length:219 start_codon:yes stop_codon:yes gene_type:complete